MLTPLRAPVRPRVISPEIDDSIPLEEVCAASLRGSVRAIEIVGGIGAGKTTALAHLAATLPPELNVLLLDDASLTPVGDTCNPRVIFTSERSHPSPGVLSYRLAPWGDDELLEYLRSVHPAACGTVMGRLRVAPDRRLPGGVPELWRVILDRMAGDEALTSAAGALAAELQAGLPAPYARAGAEQYGFAELTAWPRKAAKCMRGLRQLKIKPRVLSLLRHEVVQGMMGAAFLARALHSGAGRRLLRRRLPHTLVRATAEALSLPACNNLIKWIAGRPKPRQAMAASILYATPQGWRPQQHPAPDLSGGYFVGASWKHVNLAYAPLAHCDLSHSDLSEAVLDYAQAQHAAFRATTLSRASLLTLDAAGADFQGATLAAANARKARLTLANLAHANCADACFAAACLRGANLAQACFSHADFGGAQLVDAELDGADFSEADLRGADLHGLPLHRARFRGAQFAEAMLRECDLEAMDLPDADFALADLQSANFTGAKMPRACLCRSRLCGARLADVSWEGANLVAADLRECTFHLGSARSGLVGSPLACEGSRTGFYSDEVDQQTYQPPEAIRKANLCGADLRGARIDRTDFYLVDLRGAKYTRSQFDHFQRCRAILLDRE